MSRLRALMAYPVATLLQQLRDRTSIFFMFALPVIIMVIVGSTFGGASEVELGLVGADPAQQTRLLAEVDTIDSLVLVEFDNVEEARRAVRRFDIEGVIVLDGPNASFIADETSTGSVGVRAVAQRLMDQAAAPLGQTGLAVTTRIVGENEFADQSPFSLTAAQNLVLFTFIIALTAGAIVVRVRRNGVLRRSILPRRDFRQWLQASWELGSF